MRILRICSGYFERTQRTTDIPHLLGCQDALVETKLRIAEAKEGQVWGSFIHFKYL